MARVYLTGATGFVGRGTLEALLAAGHHVRALVRSSWSDPRVEVVRGDLLTVDHPLDGIDCVVHLAATVNPAEMTSDRAVLANVRDATLRLAERAEHARFVITSSIAAVGFRDGVVTARTAHEPVTAYGRAKADVERALRGRAVVLRPPTIFGPGERYNFLAWVRAVSRGMFRVIGDGANVFPLVSSTNVAAAIVASVEGRVPVGIHPLADPERYSIKRVHRAIARALGRRPPRLAIPRPLADVLARANEAVAPLGAPLVLSRARVRTLTVDQPFDVTSLLEAGVPLRARLEEDVAETVAEQRRAGLVSQ